MTELRQRMQEAMLVRGLPRHAPAPQVCGQRFVPRSRLGRFASHPAPQREHRPRRSHPGRLQYSSTSDRYPGRTQHQETRTRRSNDTAVVTNSDGHFKQINNLQRLVSNSGYPSLSTRADQYTNRSGRISCRMVVAISSMDLVVDDSQRMPARRIIASASATSWRQFCRLA